MFYDLSRDVVHISEILITSQRYVNLMNTTSIRLRVRATCLVRACNLTHFVWFHMLQLLLPKYNRQSRKLSDSLCLRSLDPLEACLTVDSPEETQRSYQSASKPNHSLTTTKAGSPFLVSHIPIFGTRHTRHGNNIFLSSERSARRASATLHLLLSPFRMAHQSIRPYANSLCRRTESLHLRTSSFTICLGSTLSCRQAYLSPSASCVVEVLHWRAVPSQCD